MNKFQIFNFFHRESITFIVFLKPHKECSVKHDYKAVYDDDISLHEGESIIVTETLENGWWRGYTRSKEGFFPGSYVQVRYEHFLQLRGEHSI
ncbi:hypothetical protein HELRODRAFT_67408 [Helobdella robusta]|uniref:SH3 domain-containing protein n=1 Tax=Helobdella robusta TaxID=6412 RepID=T1FZ03_HELRO|nr:hypothetical protein HELRODRAFT_67408 [Helobdella robusta]ESN99073.1 hypothetical protein HELRODRAFT_67408 [Helobdella robusta]